MIIREKLAIQIYIQSGKRLRYDDSEHRSEVSWNLEQSYIQESWLKEADQQIAIFKEKLDTIEMPLLEEVDMTGWDEVTKVRIIERRIGVQEGQQSALKALKEKLDNGR